MGSSSSVSGKNTTAAVATCRSRGSPSRPARSSRTEKVSAPRVKGSLDGERFFRQAFRRGDELRDPLFRIGQDRMAAPEEGQALLEDREGAIERKIPAGQQLHLFLEEFEGLLERRLLRHVASSFTCTWIRPSWKRTARASPTSTSAAWATTCPSSRSAIAYPRCKVASGLSKSRRRPTVPRRSRCRRISRGPKSVKSSRIFWSRAR